ncbi:aspartate kinase [Rossellomorea vietnamensis]|uniref:Aspartokinase n=1 Tax=Rossellomorea vietnamensis TaxID=218284 RepID=A0A5D4KI13_9BACI|nr:aspartate kinase [Rossellomorea vietnamensis]TYR76881.1 aspartate kinase [Rossellomorea vietnamensis]
MGLIVQKFGGTSVGDMDRIKNAALRVIEEKNRGNEVVVVVSAMGKTTDGLVHLAYQASAKPSKREMDMLLTTGEQITISLLTMVLLESGYDAVSMTGWQAGIETEDIHGNARITNINSDRVRQNLRDNRIVVVAGFQGMSESREITTLGRGGSDTTAVALAAALNADRCDIYTDVDGVYTSDPRYVKNARKLSSVAYDEMLELANLGAGVLHPRAVEFAKNHGVPLVVRSSMEKQEGTMIEEEVSMETGLIVRGVAFEEEIIRVTVLGLQNEITGLSSIFTTLAKNHINVDIIIQSKTETGRINLSFSIKKESLEDTIEVLQNNREDLGFSTIEHESGLAKVSIVGSGMISNPGVAAQMFEALANNQIPIKMVSTSEIKVSAVVDEAQMLKAAEVLHTEFNLDKAQEPQKVSVK